MILAQGQFAAGGLAILFFLSWSVVLVATAALLIFGVAIFRRGTGTAWRRIVGGGMTCCGILVPLSFEPAVSEIFRLRHGSYPLDQMRNTIPAAIGTRSDDIRESWGEPHHISKSDEGERWLYWQDAFKIGFWIVEIGPDSRIVKSYGD